MSVQTNEPGFTLKKLKHDQFHEVCGLQEEFKSRPRDVNKAVFIRHEFEESRYRYVQFVKGDRVQCLDETIGTVDGIATDDGATPSEFVRVNGRLYHWRKLKHV